MDETKVKDKQYFQLQRKLINNIGWALCGLGAVTVWVYAGLATWFGVPLGYVGLTLLVYLFAYYTGFYQSGYFNIRATKKMLKKGKLTPEQYAVAVEAQAETLGLEVVTKPVFAKKN